MNFKKTTLELIYLPLLLTNKFLRQIGIKSRNRLRIVNFHDINEYNQLIFDKQLKWLLKSWNFVSPKQFSEMMIGNEPILGHNLLLTFDDGFISNRKVAEQILKPLGIKALFFVIPDFISFDPEKCRDFITKNIYPNVSPQLVLENSPSMTWNDLSWLIKNGHTIGHHTKSHTRLSSLSDLNALNEQIIDGVEILENNLSIKIEHFAFPFGNLISMSPASLSIVRTRFPFIYTGIRGDNSRNTNNFGIKRDVIQTYDSLYYIGAILEGVADFYYKKSLSIYNSWCN